MTATKSFNTNVQNDTGKDWFQILVILTGSISMLNCGLSYYWTSPFIPKIVENKEKYNITEEQASYFAVCNLVTLTIVPLFLPPFVQRFGLKKSLVSSSVPYAIVWILKAYTVNLWLLYLARLLSGVGDAIVFSYTYIYVGEVSSPKIRNIWGNAPMLGNFLGQLVINVLGSYCSIEVTSYFCICVLVVFTIILPFMPESPYYYMAKGQYKDVKICLRNLRRKDNVDEEFMEIKLAVTKQQSETSTWMDLITIVANRKALGIALFLRLSQIVSGLFVFGSYTQFIFQKIGTNLDPKYSAIIYTGLNFILYTAGAYFSSKLGRRKSLIYSLIFCGVSVIAESIYFFIETNFPEINLTAIQWFPLLGMLLFLLFSSFGIGIIPALMLTEIFSSSAATKGCSIAAISYGLLSVAMNSIFYYIISYTGLWGPFLMFGICNFFSAIATYYIVPETKDKTLAEIQKAFMSGKNKK